MADFDELTEQQIDQRWPVLAQMVRAVEWHGDPDPSYFRRTFSIHCRHFGERMDAAEAEVAALPGKRVVEIIGTEAGEDIPDAPNAGAFLTGYFA